MKRFAHVLRRGRDLGGEPFCDVYSEKGWINIQPIAIVRWALHISLLPTSDVSGMLSHSSLLEEPHKYDLVGSRFGRREKEYLRFHKPCVRRSVR